MLYIYIYIFSAYRPEPLRELTLRDETLPGFRARHPTGTSCACSEWKNAKRRIHYALWSPQSRRVARPTHANQKTWYGWVDVRQPQ